MLAVLSHHGAMSNKQLKRLVEMRLLMEVDSKDAKKDFL